MSLFKVYYLLPLLRIGLSQRGRANRLGVRECAAQNHVGNTYGSCRHHLRLGITLKRLELSWCSSDGLRNSTGLQHVQ
ncbi:hypothetical protein EV424DRAFT_1373198 [Suillus variegatus]|nr:hypothetical protein EV424DRAFT_1389959 [Suillus variegatus]KAG1830998.1 hypothetical protein EV424DRAFT_1373198 [Suillus variegatus]